MHPILFSWDGQPVYSYGAAIVIAAVLGGVLAWRWRPPELFDLPQYLNLCLLTTIGAGFGARVLGVATASGDHGGGLSSLGVPLIVGPAIWAYCRLSGLSSLRIFDHLFPFAVFGAAFQRTFGCFLGGCCLGEATNLPWAVRFPGSADAVHPTQLYWGLALFVSFVVLLRVQPRSPGQTTCLSLGLYGLVGSVVDPLRETSAAPWLFGLTPHSWVYGATAVAFLGGAWWLATRSIPSVHLMAEERGS